MKTKEIVTIVISAIVEAVLTVILTRFLAQEIFVVIIIFVLDAVALGILYSWYSKKINEQNEILSILKEMDMFSKDDLICLKNRLKNMDLVGIKDCTDKLTGTSFTPTICMSNVKKNLMFMGVAGSKWVNDPPLITEFERMLRKVSATHGEVKFLLLNPKGAGWVKLKALRRDNLSDSSYQKLLDLSEKYTCLKVRLYDPLPSFRLQFVDDAYVAVSRYKFEFSEYEATHFGWDAPHLIVKNEEQDISHGGSIHFWSLFMAFQFVYDHIWDHSVDISVLKKSEA